LVDGVGRSVCEACGLNGGLSRRWFYLAFGGKPTSSCSRICGRLVAGRSGCCSRRRRLSLVSIHGSARRRRRQHGGDQLDRAGRAPATSWRDLYAEITYWRRRNAIYGSLRTVLDCRAPTDVICIHDQVMPRPLPSITRLFFLLCRRSCETLNRKMSLRSILRRMVYSGKPVRRV